MFLLPSPSMEKLSRSKSSREALGIQPRNMNQLRSYSTSNYNTTPRQNIVFDIKEVKIKSGNTSRISSNSWRSWSFNMDPELQRKKRIAGYKAYGVEGKMKTSLRRSFRWMKNTCSNAIHGL